MQGKSNSIAGRPDVWVALVVLVFCGIFLRDLLNTNASGAFVKTKTLPMMLVATLATLSLLLLLGSLLSLTSPVQEQQTEKPRLGAVMALVVWVALYIAALPWLGYWLTSSLFLTGSSWLFGNRRWGVILLWAVLMPLVLMLFFEKVMLILLPTSGILG